MINPFNPVLFLLVGFVVVFGEAYCTGLRRVLGAQIDLLPALMVCAGLRAGVTTVTALSVLCGLWFDALSENPLGVSVAPLFIAGLIVCWKNDLILREQTYAQCLLGFLASALVPLGTVLLLLSFERTPLLGWISIWQWIVVSLGGAAATPLLFNLFQWLDRALIYRRAHQTSFRPDRQIRRGRF